MEIDLLKVISDVGTLGSVTFIVMAAFFWAWKHLWKRGDIANEKKTLIAVLTPIVVVNAVYFFGLWQGFWSGSWDAWWDAMKVAGVEIGGSHGLMALLKIGEKLTTDEKRKD